MEAFFYSDSLEVFTGHFYKEAVSQQDNKGKNVALSALSVDIVFSMLAIGAQLETREEICKLLFINGDIEKMIPPIAELIDKLKETKWVTFKLVNKIYVRPATTCQLNTVNIVFRSNIMTIFKAEVEQVNFAKSTDAAATINGWVERKTNNLIKDLIQPDTLSEETVAVLVNAVYFKGAWTYPFDPLMTKQEDFHLADGSTVKVDMMNQRKKFYYGALPILDSTAIVLPYKDRNLCVAIILPNDVNGIEKLETLLVNGANDHLELLTWEEVDVKVPKFRMETTLNVKEVLKNLGADRVFRTDAQLRGILNDEAPIYISDAIQKAIIEVNEEGADAEAGAEVQIVLPRDEYTRPVQYFIADHSFYCQIFFKGIPIFSGAYKKP